MSSKGRFAFVELVAIYDAALWSCRCDKETGAAAGYGGETVDATGSQSILAAGLFTDTEEQNIGPNGRYTTIAPEALGKGGIKHPILRRFQRMGFRKEDAYGKSIKGGQRCIIYVG